MKVKNLIEELERCKKEYGKDFLEWEIYTEQISENEKMERREKKESFEDDELWEYFKCSIFCNCTKWLPKKIFTINIGW